MHFEEKLEKAEIIINEMVKQRKYTDISKTTENDIPMIFATSDRKEKMCIFLRVIPKLDAAEIKTHISVLESFEINHAILIYNGEPTPMVKNVLSNTKNLGKYIELFSIDDLQYNCTKHILVPSHEKVQKVEKVNPKDIPRISSEDPIARFYGFRPGDWIKITRKDNSIVYRLVKK